MGRGTDNLRIAGIVVRVEGIEPPTSCSQSRRSAKLSYTLIIGLEGGSVQSVPRGA